MTYQVKIDADPVKATDITINLTRNETSDLVDAKITFSNMRFLSHNYRAHAGGSVLSMSQIDPAKFLQLATLLEEIYFTQVNVDQISAAALVEIP